MGVQVFKKNRFLAMFSGVRVVLFSAIVIGVVFVGISQAAEANRAEGLRVLEEAILRAAVHSYAVNGYFPESIEYITENFGIYVGRRFVVHYEVFASNVLPDIRVFEVGR